MRNLLAAEFTRLFKSFIFRLGMIFSVGAGAFIVLMRYSDVVQNQDYYAGMELAYRNLDGVLFIGSLYLIFAYAAVVGIFIGTEYSDGTMRNKLAAGHTRSSIYLAELIVCGAANVVMLLAYLVTMLGLGALLIEGTSFSAEKVMLMTLLDCGAAVSLTAILLLLSILTPSKAGGSVVCILLTLVIMLGSMTVYQRIQAQPYLRDYVQVNGQIVELEPEPNPKYLTGVKRQVYEVLNDLSPVGQMYQVAVSDGFNGNAMALYDGLLVLLTTCGGILVFRRKDLK